MHDMTFDQVFGYPKSIQDVLNQIEHEEKKKSGVVHNLKKKPTYSPNRTKETNRYKNVSKFKLFNYN